MTASDWRRLEKLVKRVIHDELSAVVNDKSPFTYLARATAHYPMDNDKRDEIFENWDAKQRQKVE